MGFRLPKDARKYFKPLLERSDDNPTLRTLFEAYYLCAMVGLYHETIGEQSDLEATEFYDAYPTPFLEKRDLIAGLLIAAEISRKEIRPEDRLSLQEVMVDILDLQSHTFLSKKGHAYLDEYAAFGMKEIGRVIPKPHDLGPFLVHYTNIFAASA